MCVGRDRGGEGSGFNGWEGGGGGRGLNGLVRMSATRIVYVVGM